MPRRLASVSRRGCALWPTRMIFMLVFDEVHGGVARTGNLYAYEQYRRGAGYHGDRQGHWRRRFPLGACLATERAARGMVQGTHGSTYGGNPLAMAAAEAVLDVVQPSRRSSMRSRPKASGCADVFEQFLGNYPDMFELVRGRGLMLVREDEGRAAAVRRAHARQPPVADSGGWRHDLPRAAAAGGDRRQPYRRVYESLRPQPQAMRLKLCWHDPASSALSDAGGDAPAAMLGDAMDRKAARQGLPKGLPDPDLTAWRGGCWRWCSRRARPARACRSISRSANWAAASAGAPCEHTRSLDAARPWPTPRACSAAMGRCDHAAYRRSCQGRRTGALRFGAGDQRADGSSAPLPDCG